jgi:hypothetical protein
MHFSVRLSPPCRVTGRPKIANLSFGGVLVASAPFTYWGGIGNITIYAEAETLPVCHRRKVRPFLREWGKAAVMARLEYAKDLEELNKEN